MLATIFTGWTTDLPNLLGGLVISLELTVLILVVGFPLGVVFAFGVSAGSRIVRYATLAVVELGRGMPALVILQIFYFGLPQEHIILSATMATTLGLGLNAAAYTSEVTRAGLEGVPVGQREAARALGLGFWNSFRFVVGPEALRIATPGFMGFGILTFQDTALCYVIAVPELLSRSYELGSNNFDYMSTLLLAAMLYLAVAWPASVLLRVAERRLGQGHTNLPPVL